MVPPIYRTLIAQTITKAPMTSVEIIRYINAYVERARDISVGDVVDYLELVKAKRLEYDGKIYYYFD
jgi:hypothetical protein